MNLQFRDFDTPKRFKGRTGLQIFVDRFYRAGNDLKPIDGRILKGWDDPISWEPDEQGKYQNNYFYGGNLQGIIQKLDYIKGNHFNLIYLTPIGLSETNHHYDPIDQMQIDSWIGTWEDFQMLCDEAHARDILVAVDLVFNHTGINNPYFKEALKAPNSKFHNWFLWDENGNYRYWYEFIDMPEYNKLCEGFQDYAFSVAEKYIKFGADAIRLDLGETLPKEFMTKFRQRVKELNPEILIVSEMWDLATENGTSQFDGKQVDSVMNYPLADAILRWVRYGNALHFSYRVGEISKYPKQVQDVLWNLLDSHDTPRAITMLTGEGMNRDPYHGPIWNIEDPWRHQSWFDTYGFRKYEKEHDAVNLKMVKHVLKVASAIQYFMPGIPMVYAGTEIGIAGYKDPFNRKPYNWKEPDEEILENYKKLGALRENNKDFFSETGSMNIEISEMSMKIVRQNSSGKMILQVVRNPMDMENGWEVEVLKKVI